MEPQTGRRVTVVGAGVVGLACACRLQAAGLQVTVLERGSPGREASFGNAGGIGVSEAIPLSTPGVIWNVPRWLLDPLGPLAIRWGHLPRLLPWLWRFWRSGNPAQVRHACAALASLLGRVYEDLLPLLDEAGASGLLKREGSLTVYEHERTWRSESPMWRLRAEHGLASEKLSPEQLHELEPDLAPLFACAVRVPGWGHVADPFAVASAFEQLLRAHQGRLLTAEARHFEFTDGRPGAVRDADGNRHEFDWLVIAAGPWSAQLCEQLGERVLLESERGYHLTLPQAGVALNNMVLSAERSFVMTPMAMGLRLAGTAEFAGLEAVPDYTRADRLATHARRFFGRLDTTGATRWMGQRPSTPDSLPVIGRSARHPNVVHAFGHGHLGLTLAATTARIVADIISARAPVVDLAPFDVARFQSNARRATAHAT